MSDDRGLVLVVDDEPQVRALIVTVVRAEGLAAMEAADGKAALAKLRAADPAPCLVFLDLHMGRGGGWEFLLERGREPALAAVPVVVVSAEPHAEEALTFGATAVLRKPFSIGDVATEIRKHCGGPLAQD